MYTLNIKRLAAFIAIPVITGGVSALISMPYAAYEDIVRPPLSPGAAVFPVVWTILYILMGISAYMVSERGGSRNALILWGVQLGMNFMWSILFFNFRLYFTSLVWIIFLWLVIFAMIISFNRVSRAAAWLQVPYLLWVSFAIYLTWGVYILN